jgi:hypothetical protein
MPEPQKPDPLEELLPSKLEAVLKSLEAEKSRRREERVKAGKLIILTATVVTGTGADSKDIEAAKAATLARHLADHPEDADKVVEFDVLVIVTGVQRSEHFGSFPVAEAQLVQRCRRT